MKHVFLWVVFFVAVTAVCPVSALAAETETSLQFKSCIAGSSLISDTSCCYVTDLRHRTTYWTVDICGGVNVTGGGFLFGGRANTLLCATVKVKASNKEEAQRKAKAALQKALDGPDVRNQAKGVLGRAPNRTGPIRLVQPDDHAAEQLKRVAPKKWHPKP